MNNVNVKGEWLLDKKIEKVKGGVWWCVRRDLSEKVCERKVVTQVFNGVWKENHIFQTGWHMDWQ